MFWWINQQISQYLFYGEPAYHQSHAAICVGCLVHPNGAERFFCPPIPGYLAALIHADTANFPFFCFICVVALSLSRQHIFTAAHNPHTAVRAEIIELIISRPLTLFLKYFTIYLKIRLSHKGFTNPFLNLFSYVRCRINFTFRVIIVFFFGKLRCGT